MTDTTSGPVVPRLRIHHEQHASFVLIHLAGRFVALTALHVQEHLARALSRQPPRIVLEVQRVTEMDATAATMLHAAGQVARDRGGFLRVAAPSAAVSAAMLALSSPAVTVYRSAGDALRLHTGLDHTEPGEQR
ncbi:STAS domain-containing protein [Dactylosporangium sp. CA-092794]|uniref:STAS domain-containing protein n=1 Tax=Dactylosporangium sp. CA-092794 TaxID=3239929 RepID=UPI003D9409CC